MRVGAFELYEPLPDLKDPHAFAMLSPWIDVGRVGSSTLSLLESRFNAKELGKLRRPGTFYDFTRYRPMIYRIEGRRDIKIPNTFIKYAKREWGNDLLFFHCLEPHMFGEIYVESLLKVLEKLNVRRYCLLGAMYDSVPHSRPLIVTGIASEKEVEDELRKVDVNPSGYQGPTTINILLSEQAPKHGIETLTLVVHLPLYTQLEEDYSGQYSLLSLLCYLYNFSFDLSEIKHKGEKQYRRISMAVERNPQVKEMVKTMERDYDAGMKRKQEPVEYPRLSPEIEKFLREIGKGFNPN
jgi:predicted ATP-grasp superfamily ATP-dependent carboligase